MRHPNHTRSRRTPDRSAGRPACRAAVGVVLLVLAALWPVVPGHGPVGADGGSLLTWPLRQGGAPVLIAGLALLAAAGVLGAVGAAGRRLRTIAS